eukprot:365224-Chlamydomonas_euryale.AAC.16
MDHTFGKLASGRIFLGGISALHSRCLNVASHEHNLVGRTLGKLAPARNIGSTAADSSCSAMQGCTSEPMPCANGGMQLPP